MSAEAAGWSRHPDNDIRCVARCGGAGLAEERGLQARCPAAGEDKAGCPPRVGRRRDGDRQRVVSQWAVRQPPVYQPPRPQRPPDGPRDCPGTTAEAVTNSDHRAAAGRCAAAVRRSARRVLCQASRSGGRRVAVTQSRPRWAAASPPRPRLAIGQLPARIGLDGNAVSRSRRARSAQSPWASTQLSEPAPCVRDVAQNHMTGSVVVRPRRAARSAPALSRCRAAANALPAPADRARSAAWRHTSSSKSCRARRRSSSALPSEVAFDACRRRSGRSRSCPVSPPAGPPP